MGKEEKEIRNSLMTHPFDKWGKNKCRNESCLCDGSCGNIVTPTPINPLNPFKQNLDFSILNTLLLNFSKIDKDNKPKYGQFVMFRQDTHIDGVTYHYVMGRMTKSIEDKNGMMVIYEDIYGNELKFKNGDIYFSRI